MMKVHFFERKFNEDQISIEKLFGIIQHELVTKGVNVRVIKNPFPLRKMLAAMWYFRKNQGDINHITGDIHWAALLLDPDKTVLTIHDTVGLEVLKGWKRRLYFELWLKRPLKKLKYVTVISEKTKQEITQYLPWAEKKLRVIPNCLTTPIAAEPYIRQNAVPQILVVGTRENKNVERIIRALKDLDIQLTIVGKLSTAQQNLLQENRVNFQNAEKISNEELISLYDRSDILCFPSLYEGFGLPILEAQARQCAVITSDRLPMKSVAGNAAMLVNPENTTEIRLAVNKLLQDRKLYQEMITCGKENVNKYQPAEIAQKYLNLYNEIISKT